MNLLIRKRISEASQEELWSDKKDIPEDLGLVISRVSDAKTSDSEMRVVLEQSELTPDTVIGEACRSKAELFAWLEEWNQAERWFRESLKTKQDVNTRYLLAHSIGARGHPNEARAEFQRVIDMAPDSEEAMKSRECLKRMPPR